jgi:catechol 2,3-dioxygenase-like lactoylglutathione lyase family enzyme
MIDHVSIAVRDLRKAEPFYAAVLAPLGMRKLREWPNAAIGFGKTYPEFWINRREGMDRLGEDSGVHICLRATDIRAVEDFHVAAIRAGGASDGAPGVRAQYHSGYYAAFIRDPDGNRIEAVTFLREDSAK